MFDPVRPPMGEKPPESPNTDPDRREGNDGIPLYQVDYAALVQQVLSTPRVAKILMNNQIKNTLFDDHALAEQLNIEAYRLVHAEQYAEAELVLRTCVFLAERQRSAPQDLSLLYVTLGTVLNALARHSEAVEWLQKAYSLADGIPLSQMIALGTIAHLVIAYRGLGRTDEVARWEATAGVIRAQWIRDRSPRGREEP